MFKSKSVSKAVSKSVSKLESKSVSKPECLSLCLSAGSIQGCVILSLTCSLLTGNTSPTCNDDSCSVPTGMLSLHIIPNDDDSCTDSMMVAYRMVMVHVPTDGCTLTDTAITFENH